MQMLRGTGVNTNTGNSGYSLSCENEGLFLERFRQYRNTSSLEHCK